jgi:hypothetical protein
MPVTRLSLFFVLLENGNKIKGGQQYGGEKP